MTHTTITDQQITARMIQKAHDKYGRTAHEILETTGDSENRFAQSRIMGKMVKMPKAYTDLYPESAYLFNDWTSDEVSYYPSKKALMASLGLKAGAKQHVWHAV